MVEEASSAVSSPPPGAMAGAIRRALVIKLRHHGDVLLASPVFRALADAAPHAEIDALVYDDTAGLLAGHPNITQVHTIGRDWRALGIAARGAREWALLGALRARRYDLIVHLTEHPRGAWLAGLLRPKVSVAPERPERWWRASFTHRFPVLRTGKRHTVEMHLDALRRIGIQPRPDARRLVLDPGAAAYAKVDALLAQHALEAGRFIHVHPASRWRFKSWPAELNAQMIDMLEETGHRVVLTAAPSDAERAFIARILAATRSAPVDLTGALDLRELAALTARARMFVGVDSAPMHIAAAMRTPVVALFGPSGEFEWGPWQVAHRIVTSSDHPCRPCGQDGCGGGKVSECLTTITTLRVLAAVDALFTATKPKGPGGP